MRSGERCLSCNAGKMRTYSVRTVGLSRQRFLKCSAGCGQTGQESVKVDDLGRAIIFSNLATSSTSPKHETTPPSV